MTKARDIASAAPAPSTVSATEIGYLDGVTSAIQTQIDGKSSTSHNHDSTYVAKSLVDAKGDLLVGSANDTVSRLAVASTAGYLLTVDSAEATGLKWAAPAGGSGLTLISNTSLSAATININSVFSSTYENYVLVLNVTNMSLGANIRFRLRASGTDTTTNYGMQLMQTYQSTFNAQESTVTDYWQFGNADPTQCWMVVELARPNVASNTFALSHSITGLSGTLNDLLLEYYGAVQKSSTQFDGITIYSHNGATITGNMRIYGRANS